MDRTTTSQPVYSAASRRARHEASRSPGSEYDPTLLSRGETLILVVLLSLGLWALVWGTVSLLVAYELR